MPPPVQEREVVWARMTGYPWWPAVVSPASSPPHLGMWKVGVGKIRYHCTFLAWNKETAWIGCSRVRRFRRIEGGEGRRKEHFVMQADLKQSHTQAVELGLMILDDPGNPCKYLVKEVKVKSLLEGVEGKIIDLLDPANITLVEIDADQKQSHLNKVKRKNENVVKQLRICRDLINCDDVEESEVDVKESSNSPTNVRQIEPAGIEKYPEIRLEEGKGKSFNEMCSQSKRRKLDSNIEDLHPDAFSLEGEPEFEVVAEYDEETKLYVQDGQKMDLKTLVENISNHQEVFLISDSHSSNLKKAKSPRKKQDIFHCSSPEVRKMFDKIDPTLPEGFRVREKVRGDGMRVDKYYLNTEGTCIFRSRPAVLQYLKEQIDATS